MSARTGDVFVRVPLRWLRHARARPVLLVRELLWSCWQRLIELGNTRSAAGGLETLAVKVFLNSEVPCLEIIGDHWLETPDPECHDRTPRSIIDRERARLPEGMSGHEAIIDADCPCCQMMAGLPGPMFWHLDGSGMDDDFAFDIHHRTRQEWDAEQRLAKILDPHPLESTWDPGDSDNPF